jgi:electron transfer flavoprotein alpha subunit
VLREGIAWGLDRGVDIDGLLVSDPALAGSDTIATARALAAALAAQEPFDLILTGKNSLDADTGQVPPQLAELLDVPFASGVKVLALEDGVLTLGCELDDAWTDLEIRLPALLSCAERLCEPAKVKPDRRAEVPGELIHRLTATDLGEGPWGEAGSLTTVGEIRTMALSRLGQRSPDAPLDTQVKDAVRVLRDRGALHAGRPRERGALPSTGGPGPVVAVIAEVNEDALTLELCGAAARIADELGGSTVLLAPPDVTPELAGSWGADRLVRITGAEVAEDIARAVAEWCADAPPWALLAGSTAFGREVAARVAASVGAGLTGDAVELEVADSRLVAWKPAFGGQLVAAVRATTPVQAVTVRAGVLPRPELREQVAEVSVRAIEPRRRVRILGRRQVDSLEGLEEAEVIVGIGRGVGPADLPHLQELCQLLGAEIGCTRKITDAGWLPHGRQIGITGRSVAPRLYIAIGTSGKFNHMVGVRSAGTVLSINPDPDAPVWVHTDVGVVGTWQEVLPLLVDELRRALAEP